MKIKQSSQSFEMSRYRKAFTLLLITCFGFLLNTHSSVASENFKFEKPDLLVLHDSGLYPPNYDSIFAYQDTCIRPDVLFISQVHYSNEVRVAIDIKNDSNFGPLYKLYQRVDSVTRSLISSSVTPDELGYLQYNSLGSGKTYELDATSSCGATNYKMITQFKAEIQSDTPKFMDVSHRMMSAFEAWDTTVYSDSTVYSFLNSLSNIHYLEKTSLVQKWVFWGVVIDIGITGESVKNIFPPLNSYGATAPSIASGHCLCTAFNFRTTGIVTPGGLLSDGTTRPTAWGSKSLDGSEYKASLWRTKLGPAKHVALVMEDENAGGTTHTESTNEIYGGAPSANYAVLKLAYLCLDPTFKLSDDCECALDYSIGYLYDATLSARAEKRSGMWPLSKESGAIIEDFGMAVFKSSSSNDVRVLSATRFAVKAEDSYTINTDFLIALGDAAKSTAAAIVDINSGNYLGATQKILDGIGDVLQSFPPNPSSSSNEYDEKRMFSPLTTWDTIIKPQEVHTFAITSAHAAQMWGLRRFSSSVELVTNFGIALAIQEQVLADEPSCCIQEFGLWVTGEFPNSMRHFQNEMQTEFKSFYTPYDLNGNLSLFTPQTQHGYKIAPTTSGCPTIISAETGLVIPNQNYLKFASKSGDIYLQILESEDNVKKTCNFKVYDIRGQLLNEGSTDNNEYLILNNSKMPENKILIIVTDYDGIIQRGKYLFVD